MAKLSLQVSVLEVIVCKVYVQNVKKNCDSRMHFFNYIFLPVNQVMVIINVGILCL